MARAVAVVNNLLHNVQGKLPVSCTLNLCANFLIILIRVNVGGSTCGSAALSGRGCCNCSAGLFSRESPSGQFGGVSEIEHLFLNEGSESQPCNRAVFYGFLGMHPRGEHPTDIRLSRLQGGYTIPVQTFV